MRSLIVCCVLVMLGAAFAGCLGDAKPGNDVDKTSTPAKVETNSTANLAACAGADSANATEGEGACPVDDGTKVMDKDLGHMPHAHDYWKGKERVTLADQDIEIQADDLMESTFVNWFVYGTPGYVGGARYLLPDGATVYEGTGSVELTTTWSDPTITSLALRYRSAKGGSFSDPIQLAPGKTVTIEVTPDMSDMPHMSTSRWQFLFAPSSAPGADYGKFHLKIDIVKMFDIDLFPGHPELFEGKHEKVLLDKDGKTQQKSWAQSGVAFATGASQDDSLKPDQIVPMETQAMLVELKNVKVSVPVGQGSEVYLLYKSANTGRFRGAQRISGDINAGTYKFSVPVDMKMVDSPYAKESQWAFQVFATADPTGSGLDCGGCLDTEVTYHMTVTAFDHKLEEAPKAEDEGNASSAALAPSALTLAG